MTAPQQPTPVGQPVPAKPVPVGQPVNPVDFFRRMPGGGTVYVKPAVLAEPNACAACDAGKDEHLQRWSPDLGWHGWIAPRNEVRFARMLARRRTRTQETIS